LLAGAVGAVLVGEIACKLSQDEQEKAAEATLAVVEKEEVGAVANWQSPTRGGVSGSSTVTALNTEPNGRKCLTITDVAIIDGEETRVSKQMCRGSGDSKYAIKA
jgi:surface antigen